MTFTLRTARAVAALSALATLVSARAQDQPDGQWHGGISLGGAVASGNTRSHTLSAQAEATLATQADKLGLYGQANYARSEQDTTADLFRLGGRYDWNLGTRLFAFGGGELESNEVGGIRSRYLLNGGLGYKLLRDEQTSFDVFGGVGYSATRFTDATRRNGVELLLGEESSHKLSETSTLKQRLVVYPGDEELGLRATFDASLATAIRGGWTMNAGLGWRYAQKVADDLQKTDTLVTFGFGYKF